MTSQSNKIEPAIDQGHSVDLRVVFVDIEKYTARKKAPIQRKIVEILMECLREALAKTSKKYNIGNRSDEFDFQMGLIKIMTGDGVAIVSPFAHSGMLFFFAKQLLEEIYYSNKKTGCDADKCLQYNKEGRYCAFHPIFHVRTGIAKDLGIIYKDINGLPNVAGKAINDASRVMDIADRDQILLNKEACKEVVDNAPTLILEKDFICFRGVRVKRDIKDVYQYVGEQGPGVENYINKLPPQKVKDSTSLTRSDLEDGLKLLEANLVQEIGALKTSLGRYQILTSTEAIYHAVTEAISKAERYIRIVRLASRPKVKGRLLDVIAQRVLKDVNYDIVVAWDPEDSSDGFHDNHQDLLKKLGDNRGYDPRVLKTNGSICFDIVIVDRIAVGIGYTPSKRGLDLEQAILFEKPDVADGFVRWFDVVKKRAIPYDEWQKTNRAS